MPYNERASAGVNLRVLVSELGDDPVIGNQSEITTNIVKALYNLKRSIDEFDTSGSGSGSGDGSVSFLPTITGLVGGGATNLDGLTTDGVSPGKLYIVAATIGANVPDQFWVQVAGVLAASDPAAGLVKPVDYSPTNQQYFQALSTL